ncbi:hypothetical protein BH10PSE13_BH10PSE13_10120 [soil metagenome]
MAAAEARLAGRIALETAAAEGIGGSARFLALDVTDLAAWQAVIARVVEAFGSLGTPVNNAGGSFAIGPIDGQSLESHQKTLTVNVTGTSLVVDGEPIAGMYRDAM